jgi:hypothetical protein
MVDLLHDIDRIRLIGKDLSILTDWPRRHPLSCSDGGGKGMVDSYRRYFTRGDDWNLQQSI